MSVALFPGQGVQAAGMDHGLCGLVPEIFDDASSVLGIDVAELCRTGSSGGSDLRSTRWAQPAVLVCSVASFHRLVSMGESFVAVAGHSVGEYAALVAAGALDLAEALSLVAARAGLTAELAERTDGAMAALLRVQLEDAVRLCSETGVALAADNAPGQCVISGSASQIDRAVAAAPAAGAVARRLDVDGAFHSPLMAPAADALRDAVSATAIRPPRIAFWSSTTASRVEDPETIRRALVEQLVAPVRWRDTVHALGADDAMFTDVGPGRVVGVLARRILPEADVRFAADLLPAPMETAP